MLASCGGPGTLRQDPAVCHHGGPSLECLEALDEIADPGMDGMPSADGALQFAQAF